MVNSSMEQVASEDNLNSPSSKRQGYPSHFRIVAAVALTTCLTVFILVLVRTAWLDEDNFITLRTIDNFLNGYGLRWNVDERVQTYTHPLWMLLLLVVISTTSEYYYTVIALSMVISSAAVILLVARISRTYWQSALAILVLLSSRAFIDFSSSGLENPLSHLLLGCFLWTALSALRGRPKLFLVSLFASLCALNRPDLVLIVLPAALYTAFGTKTRWSIRIALSVAGALPLIAWTLFALVYYGAVFPNTAYAKLGHGIDRLSLLENSVQYSSYTLVQDPVTLITIAAALILPWFSKNNILKLLSLGLAAYLAYVFLIGSDYIVGRAFSVVFFGAVCLLSAGVVRTTRPFWPSIALIGICLSLLRPNPPILSGKDYALHAGPVKVSDSCFLLNVRAMHYGGTGLLNWPRGRQFPDHPLAVEGLKARLSPPKTPPLRGAVGMYGFCAGPGVHVVDIYAITDPFLARLPAIRKYPPQIGHFQRSLPSGYLDSLTRSVNVIDDPAGHELFRAVRNITTAPLWGRDRWRDILLLNLGVYQSRLKKERYSQSLEACARTWTERAHALAAEDRIEEAKAVYRDLLEFLPYEPACECLSDLYVDEGNLDGLVQEWESAAIAQPGRHLPYLYLGLAYERQGRLGDALAAYECAPEPNGDAYRFLEALARALAKMAAASEASNDIDAAIILLERAESLNPNRDDCAVSFKLLLLRGAHSDPETAKDYYRAAIAILPDNYAAFEALSECYVRAGDLQGMVRGWQSYSAQYPENYLAHFCLGLAFERQGRLDDALSAYRRSLELKTDADGTQEAIKRVLGKLARINQM